MTNLQTVLFVLGLAIALFIPTIVWTVLAIGLYDLIRDKICQVRVEKEIETC